LLSIHGYDHFPLVGDTLHFKPPRFRQHSGDPSVDTHFYRTSLPKRGSIPPLSNLHTKTSADSRCYHIFES
jgi:hypothetical protein